MSVLRHTSPVTWLWVPRGVWALSTDGAGRPSKCGVSGVQLLWHFRQLKCWQSCYSLVINILVLRVFGHTSSIFVIKIGFYVVIHSIWITMCVQKAHEGTKPLFWGCLARAGIDSFCSLPQGGALLLALKNVTDLSLHCSKSHEWLLGSNKSASQEPRSHLSVALRYSAAQWAGVLAPSLPTPVSVLCEAIWKVSICELLFALLRSILHTTPYNKVFKGHFVSVEAAVSELS